MSEPQTALIPWRKQAEGRPGAHPPRDPWRKRNNKEAVAEAAQHHRKARTGFATAPGISNTQARKGNPGASRNSQMYGAVQERAALLPNPHWQSRGWLCRTHPPQPKKKLLEPQASPQPAVSSHITKAENTTKPSFSANHSLIFLFVQ